MNNTIYKKIYQLKCKLETALHIGCAEQTPIGAMNVMKTGDGKILIPGTSIAGVFFYTLRHFIENDTLELLDKDNASPIVFRSSTFSNNVTLKIRDRVKINRELKTAEDGSLFSYWEIEPEDAFFNIEIEVDNLSMKLPKINNEADSFDTIDSYIQNVLDVWMAEGFFLGAHNSSGNGKVKIVEVNYAEINQDSFASYLKNDYSFKNYRGNQSDKSIYKKYLITVSSEDETDGYGTNALLIKGGASHNSLVNNGSDAIFINTGKRLFIPGSSLKGAFSMFVEKYDGKELLKDLFGQEDSDNQGYIYFPDLFFEHVNENHLINIERHAEDEFTRAVLGSAKFNEERLFYNKAKGHILVPTAFYENNKEKVDRLFELLNIGLKNRLISIGANSCYPKIEIEEV